MQNRVAEILNKYNLRTKKIVLAVSGGIDSVVLFDLAIKLLPKENLMVAHVNHGLRKESDRDEAFVKKMADDKGIRYVTKKIKMSGKSEAEARQKRYEFLIETKNKYQANFILTAHNLNDQAETILFNFARGVGPLDFWGMRELEGDILRPMLFISRAQIESYAKKSKLKWREDKSNKDLKYSRNLIREKVIPELQKINPNLLERVGNETRLGQGAEDQLLELVAVAEKRVREGNALKIPELNKQPEFIKSSLIHRMLKEIVGEKGVSAKNVAAVFDILSKKGTKKTEIGGFTITKNYDKISFGKKLEKTISKATFRVGEDIVFNGFKIKSKIGSGEANSKNILLDPVIASDLSIRSWKEGDRIITSSGTKKLQDVFTDAKVPLELRKSWPIISDANDKIYWVAGLAASKEAKSKSKESLIIEVTK